MRSMALCAFLVGCMPKPNTSVAGPIPVVITNHFKEPICELTLSPNTTVMGHKDVLYLAIHNDWKKSPPIEPGQTVRASVMAGSYSIDAATCDISMVSDQYFGYHDIKGPTAIGLDGPETTAPADYTHWEVKMKYAGHGDDAAPAAGCLPAGSSIADNADASRCCSGRMDYPDGDSRRAECAP